MSDNESDESDMECPLCVETLDASDRNFLPCPCGYRVCMWCWHNIRENLNGLCPACRSPYNADPHAFSIVDQQDVLRKQRERRLKEKAERRSSLGLLPSSGGSARGVSSSSTSTAVSLADRRHLHNYRVIQRNLVYVIGIPVSASTEEILRRPEYFGQYGKIGKIVVHGNRSLSHSTVSVYITFSYKEDAKAAIQVLDGFWIDGHHLRASFGTTKYCNNFIRGVSCNNPECVYLHDIGEDEDRFTKEEIQAGHSKLTPIPGSDQTIVTGNGGPSGTGKRPVGETVLPVPIFIQDIIHSNSSSSGTSGGRGGAAAAAGSSTSSSSSFSKPLMSSWHADDNGAEAAETTTYINSPPSPERPGAYMSAEALAASGHHQHHPPLLSLPPPSASLGNTTTSALSNNGSMTSVGDMKSAAAPTSLTNQGYKALQTSAAGAGDVAPFPSEAKPSNMQQVSSAKVSAGASAPSQAAPESELVQSLRHRYNEGRSEALRRRSLAASFNGLGSCAVFPVPVSSLAISIWNDILNESTADLTINPYSTLELTSFSELLELTLPPVDAGNILAKGMHPYRGSRTMANQKLGSTMMFMNGGSNTRQSSNSSGASYPPQHLASPSSYRSNSTSNASPSMSKMVGAGAGLGNKQQLDVFQQVFPSVKVHRSTPNTPSSVGTSSAASFMN